MARKRRRSIALLATIVTITVLDLMGASYGYWNDSLHISGALSTGTLEPIFAACVDLKERHNCQCGCIKEGQMQAPRIPKVLRVCCFLQCWQSSPSLP